MIAFVAAAHAAEPTDRLADRVILLANSEDPDSLKIARHYAEARGVPAANLYALRMPLAESISWREFVVAIWQPLIEQLVRDKWIDAIPMEAVDAIGRQKFAPNGHRIAALVICRGVPLKIAHEPDFYVEVPPFTVRSEFRTNAGSVDGELSLLARPTYAINAYVPNPLFQNESPTKFEEGMIVKVARLDGPSARDAMGLVDRAVAAERSGLLGRAYLDFSGFVREGDEWLESAERHLIELGFDLQVDRPSPTIAATARFDAPAIYFGWYTGNLDGPFALPGFEFPPGAIALHIHSSSASTMRSVASGWTGPLVARGVTATFGNVHEPYLHLTHRPNLLLRALARGWTLGDAAYFALMGVSWQAIVVGDPLYRPFAVPFSKQIENLSSLPPLLAGYAVLRRMRALDGLGRKAEATALAVKAQREVPSIAVGVALAQRLRESGETDSAANALGFVALLKQFPTDQWALAGEAAQLLAVLGRPARAVEIWRTLLGIATLPPGLRLTWLREAHASALAAKDQPQAAAWQNEIAALAPPTEAPK